MGSEMCIRDRLEILYDGREEALGDVISQAKKANDERAEFRRRLIVPAANADLAFTASEYSNPDLGRIAVEKKGVTARLRTAAWNSTVASRHNDDETISLITIDPGVDGIEFVIGKKDGKRTLTTRDGQHTYEFVEIPAVAQ